MKTNVQVKVAQEDPTGDLPIESQHYSEPPVDIHVNRAAWEDRLRKYTEPFARYTNIYHADAYLLASAETRRCQPLNPNSNSLQPPQALNRRL